MVLEIALHYYGVAVNLAKSSYTMQYEQLRDSRLLFDKNKMRDRCKAWLRELNDLGIYSKEMSVVNEMKDLYHELSTRIHHPRGLIAPGIYIGGEQPLTSALSLAMLTLQKEGHCQLQLNVLDEQYQARCKLVDGQVKQVRVSAIKQYKTIRFIELNCSST